MKINIIGRDNIHYLGVNLIIKTIKGEVQDTFNCIRTPEGIPVVYKDYEEASLALAHITSLREVLTYP